MLDERPSVVEERSRVGGFKGDLIVGRNGKSAIGTLVDRTTRVVRLVRLPDARHGEATAAAITGGPSRRPGGQGQVRVDAVAAAVFRATAVAPGRLAADLGEYGCCAGYGCG